MFEEYCSRCGECCKNIYGTYVFFPEELYMEIEANGSKEQKEQLKLVNEGGIIPLKEGTKECSLLQEDNGKYSCRIQLIRPPMCREYPLQQYFSKKRLFPSCTVPAEEVLKEIRRREDEIIELRR